ncbi:MAG: hypothetical protein R2932_30790 [Caldilineaceae bacterium]
MTKQKNTLELMAKGAISGIAGTVALTAGMQLLPALMTQATPLDPQRDMPDEPNVKLVEEVMLALWGTLPADQTKAVGGQFIIGAMARAGCYLCVAARSLPSRPTHMAYCWD